MSASLLSLSASLSALALLLAFPRATLAQEQKPPTQQPGQQPTQQPAPQPAAQPRKQEEPKHVAYPTRDLLTPFRSPTDVYAPPDELFHVLRTMQALADAPGAKKEFDKNGVEVIDDPNWRQARGDMAKLNLDAGYLAQIIRLNRNPADRATAFYAMYFCPRVDDVFNLIGHIPGEPLRRTRELALPRAIEFMRANMTRRFGDLSKEQQDAIRQAMPEPGSPVAKSQGIVRGPIDEDFLHKVNLVPFFQLLDVDPAIDQAQALWFLKEVFLARQDLALGWLEPALPRVHQLLRSPSPQVRAEAIGMLQAIGPKDLREPPADDADALIEWAKDAEKALFPPIRNLNDTIVALFPSPERDALVAAGELALQKSSIGHAADGQRKDGTSYRGYRIAHVPDELKPFAIPKEAVVTTVNGVNVTDAATLLQQVKHSLAGRATGRKVFVEYVLDGQPHAIEYRVM
jgi:hypothetical protein